jgi:carbamoyltransferase
MNVLGISGSERHAAAAVAVDGRVAAAASEESFVRLPAIGYRYTGGMPGEAIRACLDRAGLTLDDIDRVLVVGDAPDGPGDPDAPSRPPEGATAFATAVRRRSAGSIEPLLADAHQLGAAAVDEDLLGFVASTDAPALAVVERRDGRIGPPCPIAGSHELLCAIKRTAAAVTGAATETPLADLERTAAAATPDAAMFARVLDWSGTRFTVDEPALAEILAPLHAVDAPDADADAAQYQRHEAQAAVAAGLCARVATLLADCASRAATHADIACVGLAGDVFAGAGLASTVAGALGRAAVFAPVAGAAGRAIGAALAGNGARPQLLDSLALGPEFAEGEIKRTLENCRLDYLYEPDWARLLARVSRLLARGSVVAWFHGATPFGGGAVGTRSILCDPSNRYARDNLNRFLRHGEPDDPLPLSMTADAAAECLDGPAGSPFLCLDAAVRPEWRDRLKAAVDRRQRAPVRIVTDVQAPQLAELLRLHRQRTGVPGLVNLPLRGHGEPTACTPRDAVRAVYSSAIDALVIGRFLLMKDYWMLRSGADQ